MIELVKMLFWILFLLICYTYAIYPVILLLFRKRKKHSGELKNNFPSVSVVVSAYNEEKIIGEKIKSLLTLDYPKEKLEIVIASDGSTDNTDILISKHLGKGINFVRFDERRGKLNALNNIIPRLKGEIVIFSDANTIFKTEAIKKLVQGFSEVSVGAVSGELIFQNPKDNEVGSLEGLYWHYEQFLKRIEGANGALLGANGGIYAIRRRLFEPLPSDVIVEDFVLPMKILEKGYQVIYEPEAIAYEETSKKIIQEMERRIRIGAGDFQALLLTWRMLNPLRGFPAFAYLSHKVIRWFVPFFLIFVFLANMFLLNQEFYFITFLLQCIFYLIAIIGRMLSRLNLRFKLFGLPYYFISMNIALFFGFIRYCTNSQSVTWERTQR